MRKITSDAALKQFLDDLVLQVNCPAFIENDPIQIPHSYSRREDIEISAFLTASLAWGKRSIIISKAYDLMRRMDNTPYKYITQGSVGDFKSIEGFVHRTFNSSDCIFFLHSLRNIYKNHGGLRSVFTNGYKQNNSVRESLIYFRTVFFEIPYPPGVSRHLSDVERNSAAKRLNLFLLWMVRRDSSGVHFGLWDEIPPSALFIPLDLHCGNVARSLGLLSRKQNDWKAVEELTARLRNFDPDDPIKYDFALFGAGVNRIPLPLCSGKLFM